MKGLQDLSFLCLFLLFYKSRTHVSLGPGPGKDPLSSKGMQQLASSNEGGPGKEKGEGKGLNRRVCKETKNLGFFCWTPQGRKWKKTQDLEVLFLKAHKDESC